MTELGFIATQTSAIGIAACWKGIDLKGAVSWFGVGQWVARRRTWPGKVIRSTHYKIIMQTFLTQKWQSKKISNDQELIQSDPTSCPINQKGNN